MGTIWLIFSTARATWSPIADGSLAKLYPNALAVLVLSWILCILCVSMVGFALPAFRKRFHNQFECIHRFVGWMTLFIFWVRFILPLTSSVATPRSSATLWERALSSGSSTWP